MEYPFDSFFISIAESTIGPYLAILYGVIAVLGVIGFVYYMFKALSVLFLTSRKLRANYSYWERFLIASNPFHLEHRPFEIVLFKALLAWLLAGWPLVLLMTGLVSENAFPIFSLN